MEFYRFKAFKVHKEDVCVTWYDLISFSPRTNSIFIILL